MALNFRSLAHQRNFLTIIVSRMETYERAAAMPSSLTYRQSILLGCTVSPVRPALLPFRFGPPFVESSTSRFSEAIQHVPRERMESDRDLLRSGSPSAALKNRRT